MPTKMSVQQRSYCFDYDKLVQSFDINLEMQSGQMKEEKEDSF
jgi:DNA primase